MKRGIRHSHVTVKIDIKRMQHKPENPKITSKPLEARRKIWDRVLFTVLRRSHPPDTLIAVGQTMHLWVKPLVCDACTAALIKKRGAGMPAKVSAEGCAQGML